MVSKSSPEGTNGDSVGNELASDLLNLPQFVAEYSSRFPVVICTRTGHYGVNEVEDISANQIFLARKIFIQVRLLAQMSNGKYVSIPTTSTHNFVMLEKPNKVPKVATIEEIISRSKQGNPLKIALTGNSQTTYLLGGVEMTSEKIGALSVLDTYNEQFVIVHRIEDDAVLSPEPLAFPIYVGVKIQVIHGQEDISAHDWSELMRSYSRQLSQLKASNQNIPEDLHNMFLYDKSDFTFSTDDDHVTLKNRSSIVNATAQQSYMNALGDINNNSYAQNNNNLGVVNYTPPSNNNIRKTSKINNGEFEGSEIVKHDGSINYRDNLRKESLIASFNIDKTNNRQKQLAVPQQNVKTGINIRQANHSANNLQIVEQIGENVDEDLKLSNNFEQKVSSNDLPDRYSTNLKSNSDNISKKSISNNSSFQTFPQQQNQRQRQQQTSRQIPAGQVGSKNNPNNRINYNIDRKQNKSETFYYSAQAKQQPLPPLLQQHAQQQQKEQRKASCYKNDDYYNYSYMKGNRYSTCDVMEKNIPNYVKHPPKKDEMQSYELQKQEQLSRQNLKFKPQTRYKKSLELQRGQMLECTEEEDEEEDEDQPDKTKDVQQQQQQQQQQRQQQQQQQQLFSQQSFQPNVNLKQTVYKTSPLLLQTDHLLENSEDNRQLDSAMKSKVTQKQQEIVKQQPYQHPQQQFIPQINDYIDIDNDNNDDVDGDDYVNRYETIGNVKDKLSRNGYNVEVEYIKQKTVTGQLIYNGRPLNGISSTNKKIENPNFANIKNSIYISDPEDSLDEDNNTFNVSNNSAMRPPQVPRHILSDSEIESKRNQINFVPLQPLNEPHIYQQPYVLTQPTRQQYFSDDSAPQTRNRNFNRSISESSRYMYINDSSSDEDNGHLRQSPQRRRQQMPQRNVSNRSSSIPTINASSNRSGGLLMVHDDREIIRYRANRNDPNGVVNDYKYGQYFDTGNKQASPQQPRQRVVSYSYTDTIFSFDAKKKLNKKKFVSETVMNKNNSNEEYTDKPNYFADNKPNKKSKQEIKGRYKIINRTNDDSSVPVSKTVIATTNNNNITSNNTLNYNTSNNIHRYVMRRNPQLALKTDRHQEKHNSVGMPNNLEYANPSMTHNTSNNSSGNNNSHNVHNMKSKSSHNVNIILEKNKPPLLVKELGPPIHLSPPQQHYHATTTTIQTRNSPSHYSNQHQQRLILPLPFASNHPQHERIYLMDRNGQVTTRNLPSSQTSLPRPHSTILVSPQTSNFNKSYSNNTSATSSPYVIARHQRSNIERY